MRMISLKEMWEYNHKANTNVIVIINSKGSENKKMMELMSHIINAHKIWLDRIEGKKSKPEVWKLHNKNKWSQLDRENHQRSLQQLDKDPNEIITYKNSKGVKYQSTIGQIFFQLISHSAYHRGQIALILRELNIEPPVTDYIFYSRSKEADE